MRINKSLITYIPTTGAGSGTVTSVALTAPTGFTVSGSPVTSAGTLALSFTTGYGIPPLMTGNTGKFLTTNGTTMSWVNIAGTDVTGAALTEVDDTNVTLTLGGTPSTALLRSVSMTLGWAGQLAVSRGGSGAATLTGVLIGNGTSAFTAVTGGPNQILRVNGTATGYEFYTASFLTNPMTLNYDMIYQSGGVPTRLPGPTSSTKQFLTAQGNGTATTSLGWGTIATADIPSAALTRTNDTNVQITLGGTPASALLQAVSLTMGWTGQLSVGRGGSGASTLTGVLVGNGTSAFTAVVGTAGQFLRRNTANTAYEFRTLQGSDIAGSELTFSNDTNVQMTLGGTPASALLQPVSINLGWTGQLAVGRGGTGASTLTGVLIGNGTSAVTEVSGTAGQLLRRNTANTAYEFFTASLITGNGTADYVPIWTSANNLLDSPLSFVSGEANFGSYKLVAGNASATDGSILLQDNYSIGHLANLCTNRSAGNPVLTYGLTTSTSTTNVFLSATSIDIQKGSLSVSGQLTFRSATSAAVSIGTTVTMTERFTITNGGQMVLPMYTSSSSMPGTAAGVLAFNSIGSIITIAAPGVTSSGTYTPTWSGLANVDSVTAFSCQYMRVGDTVTVSGWVTINATADNTPTSLSFSLPINSATSSVNYLNGTGVAQGGGPAAALSGYASNFGEFEVIPAVDTDVNYSFIFTYRIV